MFTGEIKLFTDEIKFFTRLDVPTAKARHYGEPLLFFRYIILCLPLIQSLNHFIPLHVIDPNN